MSYKVNDLPLIERPREKLIKYGPERLENYELLSIILRVGSRDLGVIELAKRVLSQVDVAEVTFQNLAEVRGLGKVQRCEIIAFVELGKRLLQKKTTKIILTPEEVWSALKVFTKQKKEHFIALYLDSRHQEIKQEVISVGTLNASLVHPREVFEPAIRNFASALIVAHNHPSNNILPSEEDIAITRKLKRSGELLGIELLDHVIVTSESFYSFKANGLL